MNERQIIQDLQRLDGVSLRMAEQLVRQGVQGLDDLTQKLNSGLIVNRQLKLSLEKLRCENQQVSQRLALQLSNPVISRLRSTQVVENVDYVGSLRREKLVVSDVNILVSCKTDVHSLIFQDVSRLGEVLQKESDRLVLLRRSDDCTLPIEIRIVNSDEWIPALFWYTGSSNFVSRLRALALKEGITLSSHSIEKNGERIACSNEEELFQLIKIEYVSAYLRRT